MKICVNRRNSKNKAVWKYRRNEIWFCNDVLLKIHVSTEHPQMLADNGMINDFIEIISVLNWKHRTRNVMKICVLFSRCASNCTTYSTWSPTILDFFHWLQITADEDYIDIIPILPAKKSLLFRPSKSKQNLAKWLSVALVVVRCLFIWEGTVFYFIFIYLIYLNSKFYTQGMAHVYDSFPHVLPTG